MDRLYPPSIAGVLPSFYKTSFNGTAVLTVPFSMNKTVGIQQVSGYSLRIKTTNTDVLYGVIESTDWSEDIANPYVTFVIPDKILKRLTIGSFYKVQLAYKNTLGTVGYYSSVGILKYTSEPVVSISDFYLDTTNVNKTEYVGIYENKDDPTEKAYQYRFNLYTREGILLETSGWKFHNSYEDVSLTYSTDRYVLNYALEQNSLYKIEYEVITNNNLTVKSPSYLVMDSESIAPEVKVRLVAELDYNNACINLSLIGDRMEDGSEYTMIGAFLLSRASSLDNYSTWLPISRFRMTGQKPSSFLLNDYTIEQGATYIYSLQQFNDHEIYSNRILTDYIEGQFEDVFLYDGERQLKIKFNPKISTFKTVHQESKKNTLGSKYPYVFRNGVTAYKEFPIAGLISYMMDENEFFLSIEKDLYIKNWEHTTDIIDSNVLVERLFKLKVLDWLNNGKPKLFKSPQEGNYIVRLMNVQLQPIDTVSRMIHNFSCQATEITDYTPENLTAFGLLKAEDVPTYQMKWETIILADRADEGEKLLKEAQEKLANGTYTENEYHRKLAKIQKEYSIYNTDLLRGQRAYHIKITDMIMGATFSFIDANHQMQIIMIGATGAYEIFTEEPIRELKLLVENNASANSTLARLKGSITFGIRSAQQNRFDTITEIYNQNIPIFQIFGPHDNILKDYQNLKKEIVRINYARFTKMDVIDVFSPLFGEELENGIILNGVVEELNTRTIYDIQTLDSKNQIQHNYYRYYQGKLYNYPHFVTLPADYSLVYINPYTLYKDSDLNAYYRLIDNQLVIEEDYEELKDGSYNFKYTDLNLYTVYHKRVYDENGNYIDNYYKYNGVGLEKLENYSTKIQYGNITLDIGDSRVREFSDMEDIPAKISIGSGVIAELGLQVKIIVYSLESSANCEDEKADYTKALINYHAKSLDLALVDNNELLELDGSYKIWREYTFQNLRLDSEMLKEYQTGTCADVDVYEPSPLPYSQEEINKAYEDLLIAEEKFMAKLEESLREQEEKEEGAANG